MLKFKLWYVILNLVFLIPGAYTRSLYQEPAHTESVLQRFPEITAQRMRVIHFQNAVSRTERK